MKTAQMTDRLNENVGDLVAENFRFATVFAKHGIDFCCGDQTPLAAICRDKSLNPSTVLSEIEAIGDATHAIHHLAKDYAIPKDVCNAFVVTYQKLKEFEDDLHKHVHLENNILFPKAAQL